MGIRLPRVNPGRQTSSEAVARVVRDALAACNDAKQSDNLQGVQSTASIDSVLDPAQGIVTRLDAAIRNKYKQNPDKLAAWKSASRVARAPRKAKTPEEPATAPAA